MGCNKSSLRLNKNLHSRHNTKNARLTKEKKRLSKMLTEESILEFIRGDSCYSSIRSGTSKDKFDFWEDVRSRRSDCPSDDETVSNVTILLFPSHKFSRVFPQCQTSVPKTYFKPSCMNLHIPSDSSTGSLASDSSSTMTSVLFPYNSSVKQITDDCWTGGVENIMSGKDDFHKKVLNCNNEYKCKANDFLNCEDGYVYTEVLMNKDCKLLRTIVGV